MRLAARTALPIAAIVTIALLAHALFEQRAREQAVRSAMAAETQALAAVLHPRIEAGLNASPDGLIDAVAAGLGAPEVAAMMVVDGEGDVLAGAGGLPEGCVAGLLAEAVAGSTVVWARCDGPVRAAVLPLPDHDARFLFAQRAQGLRAVRAQVVSSMGSALLLALLASLAVALLLQIRIQRPLARLLRPIEEKRAAEESPRVALGPDEPLPDELVRIAAAMDLAADRANRDRRLLKLEREAAAAMMERLRSAEDLAVAGRLTAGLLHEVGAPLSVITLQTKAILASDEATHGLRGRIDEIDREVRRIVALVDGLLRMARRHGLDFEPLDLRDVVRSAWSEVAQRASSARIEPTLRMPRAPLSIRGNAVLLRHALLNILTNAVQALSSHDGERRLIVEAEPEERNARVVVEDSGPGVAPEILPRLFSPFSTTKDPHEGSGLGLVITRTILEEHGGMVRIEQRARGGTIVIVSLPLHRPYRPQSA
jgi:two-component system, NtrC family, sensor kinase